MRRSAYESLRAATRGHDNDPAFTFVDARLRPTSYTFGRLFATVEDLAGSLASRRLDDPRSVLGLLLSSQEDQVLHYLAALRAGAVPAVLTPPNPKLDPDYYARTMTEVVRRSRFAALITDIDLPDFDGPSFSPRVLEPTRTSTPRTPTSRTAPALGASFLQFSSGTTGIKRGVLVTDEALLSQLGTYADALEVTRDDTLISWLPLYHDMGFIACLNLPVFVGAHTIMMEPMDWVSRPSLWLRAASTFGATLSWNPNFAYAFMAQRAKDADLVDIDLSALRALVNCSEPTTQVSQSRFSHRFSEHGLAPDVFKGCYAMAETTFALTHGEPTWDHARDELGATNETVPTTGLPRISVGRPLPGVELEIRDARGMSCRDREIGELWARSPFTFSGYYLDDDATGEAFDGDWYHTGDLGYRIEDAYFVTGRSKDVLIVGGVNVFPEDLERLAGEVEGILPGRVAAFSEFDEQLQSERITMVAETDLEDAEGMNAMLEVRQRVLAAFQIANFGVHLVPPGWLVKSSSGKVARSENQRKWAARSGP